MLWFSIPAVILLASIPVFIIVSQTTEFSMPKISFETKMACFLFLVAAYSAYSGLIVATPINTVVMVLWLLYDEVR